MDRIRFGPSRRAQLAFAGAYLAACMTAAGCSPPPSESQGQASALEGDDVFHFSTPVVSTANVPRVREDVTFLVRFVADHPLGRAQALQASGRRVEAERLARTVLRRERNLHGLCFERFTLGGAEIVLGACTAPALNQQQAFQSLWTKRFAGMASVEYADVNLIAQIENRSPL